MAASKFQSLWLVCSQTVVVFVLNHCHSEFCHHHERLCSIIWTLCQKQREVMRLGERNWAKYLSCNVAG